MKYIASFILLFALACCQGNYRGVIDSAQRVLADSPDSSLILLLQIDFPEKLPPELKARYGLVQAQADARLENALINDTLVLYSVEYYKEKGRQKELMSAYVPALKHYLWTEDILSFEEMFGQAMGLAHQLQDSVALSQLYVLRAGLQDADAAAQSYKLASEYDSTCKANLYYLTALQYAFALQGDSARKYFEASIRAYEPDEGLKVHYIRNYAGYLIALRQFEEAREFGYRIQSFYPRYADAANLNLAEIHLHEGNLDSVSYYLQKNRTAVAKGDPAKESASRYNIAGTLQAVLDYAQGKGVNIVAQGQRNDSLMRAILDNDRMIRQHVVSRNRMQYRDLKLQVRQQRLVLTIVLLVALGLVSAMGLYFYTKNKRDKALAVQEENEVLQRMLEEALSPDGKKQQDSHFFKRILLQKLGLIRIVANTPTPANQQLLRQVHGRPDDRKNKDDLLDWKDLYPVVDSLYEGFYSRMKEKYADRLNEKEMQLCCLLRADFSTKEISSVTGQSVRTIYQRKTTIRQKIGIDEKGDIVLHIDQSSV